MNRKNYRFIQLSLFILSFFVLLASLYFQFVGQMEPCPLCLMQRYCVGIALLLAVIGWANRFQHRVKLIGILQLLVGLSGVYFASRQLWLQSLPPDQMPACLPGLDVLIRYFPLKDVLHALFWGTADCGETSWTWLGFSMPAWSLFYFLSYLIMVFLLHLRFWFRTHL